MALTAEAQIDLLLNDFGRVFRESLALFATKYPNKKTGQDTLSDSDIVKDVKVEVRDERLVISVYRYYEYIESGRKKGAKNIPLDVIITWMKKNNIVDKNQAKTKGRHNVRHTSGKNKGKFAFKYIQLAFIIQKSIRLKGIGKRPIFTKAYQYTTKQFDKQFDDVINSISEDIIFRFTVKNKSKK